MRQRMTTEGTTTMGYYTDYRLSATDADNNLVDIDLAFLANLSGYSWSSEDGELMLFQAKWYDHKDHMEALSDAFPGLRLELFCAGEDDDQWFVYATGGKVLVCRSARVFEPNTLWTESI